jgi:phage-related protein
MGKPQVTLTFAGDATKLTQAFDQVGASARKMDTDVGTASRDVGSSFDTVGEAADGAEGKAQGFSDTLTGTKDVMGGAAEIAKGNLFEGFVQVGQGAADLAGGLASFVIPAIKNMTTSMIGNAVQTVKSTAVTAAHRVATIASAVATNAMTVAQKALNLAMRANPIGLVITAILLLVGAIVYAYKNSETFRRIVDGAFRAVQKAASFAFGWIRDNWRLLLGIVTGPIGLAVTAVGKHVSSIVGFFKGVPGAIAGFLSGVADRITAPFRSAFNSIRNLWNSTLGGKGFSFPGFDPPGPGSLPGFSFTIPSFHTGGVMPGAPGTEGLALLQAGERITPAGRGGGVTVIVNGALDPIAVAQQIQQMLRKLKSTNGGLDLGLA